MLLIFLNTVFKNNLPEMKFKTFGRSIFLKKDQNKRKNNFHKMLNYQMT